MDYPNTLNIIRKQKRPSVNITLNNRPNSNDFSAYKFQPGTWLNDVIIEDYENQSIMTSRGFMEYVRDLYLNKNVFFGGGAGIHFAYINHIFRIKIQKTLDGMEELFEEVLKGDSEEYSSAELFRDTLTKYLIPNFPLNLYSYGILIKLDGSVGGSIKKDVKFWWDNGFKKNGKWGEYKLIKNEYLIIR